MYLVLYLIHGYLTLIVVVFARLSVAVDIYGLEIKILILQVGLELPVHRRFVKQFLLFVLIGIIIHRILIFINFSVRDHNLVSVVRHAVLLRDLVHPTV